MTNQISSDEFQKEITSGNDEKNNNIKEVKVAVVV
jgi:hypothetical protein